MSARGTARRGPSNPTRRLALAAACWMGLAGVARAQPASLDSARVLPVLGASSASCPARLMLTEVRLDDATVQVHGRALSNELVAQLLATFDASDVTTAVALESAGPEQWRDPFVEGPGDRAETTD